MRPAELRGIEDRVSDEPGDDDTGMPVKNNHVLRSPTKESLIRAGRAHGGDEIVELGAGGVAALLEGVSAACTHRLGGVLDTPRPPHLRACERGHADGRVDPLCAWHRGGGEHSLRCLRTLRLPPLALSRRQPLLIRPFSPALRTEGEDLSFL